ncbi:putative endo-1,3-beta-glucanase, partial [Globisporangium splendens]
MAPPKTLAALTTALASVALLLHPVHAQSTYDTWETGALTPDKLLVEHTSEMSDLCAPRNVEAIAGRPIPTNTWWGNLITCDPTASNTPVSPIWPNPHAITIDTTSTTGDFGFAIGYPYRMRYFGGYQANGAPRYYGHAVLQEALLSAREFTTTAVPTLRVASWTDLGVKVQMRLPTSATQYMESNLVIGMPYFTTTYQNLTPRLVFNNPIATINGANAIVSASYSGSRFVFVTVNGNKWILYATAPTSSFTFRLDSNVLLRGTSGYVGTLRLVNTLSETHTNAYDSFKECVVTGGSVDLTTDSTYGLQWDTVGDCSQGLLHFALPHQRASIVGTSAPRVVDVAMNATTRGEMAAILISFYPKTRWTNLDSVGGTARMLQTLVDDMQAPWPIATLGSLYFNGMAAQKYASLCLMANDRVIVGNDVSILRACMTKLETVLAPFLDNAWYYKIKYDTVYGGIVTSEAFATRDLNADFGNTVYNDHHYHYGYWVYTAAVVNFLHPTWPQLPALNAMTRLLLRDVATPNGGDPFFPKFRHFDWFRGHSYSHGVTAFADGKDQESSSEGVNFAYALYLYGTATKNARMATIGKLMTKLNARAIQTYFLMESSNTVHPAEFRANKVTGIFFDNKADYATWFSAEKYCIQMIPVSAVTEFVCTRQFVQEEWDAVLSREKIATSQGTQNSWLSLLYANYARVNRGAALQVLQQYAVDDGLTWSWALYMAVQLN